MNETESIPIFPGRIGGKGLIIFGGWMLVLAGYHYFFGPHFESSFSILVGLLAAGWLISAGLLPYRRGYHLHVAAGGIRITKKDETLFDGPFSELESLKQSEENYLISINRAHCFRFKKEGVGPGLRKTLDSAICERLPARK